MNDHKLMVRTFYNSIEREAQRNHEEGTAKPSLSWLQDNDDDDA